MADSKQSHTPELPADDPIVVAEQKTQRRGTLLLCLGAALAVGMTVIPTRMLVYSPAHFDDPVKLTGTILNVLTVLGVAFVCLGFGLAERVQRSNRSAYQQQIREQNARLAAVEKAAEKLPTYPETFMDGFDYGRGTAGSERP